MWGVLARMRFGVVILSDWTWNRLLLISPFAPAQLFYTVAPVLTIYLYTDFEASRLAFDAIAAETRMP